MCGVASGATASAPSREGRPSLPRQRSSEPHSLLHHPRHGWLDLGLVVRRVVALARDDAQVFKARALAVRNGLFDLLERLLDVEAVQVDRAIRLLLVVLCGQPVPRSLAARIDDVASRCASGHRAGLDSSRHIHAPHMPPAGPAGRGEGAKPQACGGHAACAPQVGSREST